MSDCQVGDLALCLGLSVGEPDTDWLPKRGCIYTVCDIEGDCLDGGLGLEFLEDPEPMEDWLWAAEDFVKVTPEAADEFDRETISLMNSAPVKEPALKSLAQKECVR